MFEELNRAIQYHQSGQLEEAKEIYTRILSLDPNHSDALHLLGFIAYQKGKNDLAVDLINRAIQSHSESAFYYNNLALALMGQGKTEEAIECCRIGLKLDPNMAEAHYNMGNALQEQGRSTEAISCYQKAIEIKPDHVEAYNNMGAALKERGTLDQAISSYQKALEIKADYFKAYNNMGIVRKAQGRLTEAITCYQKAIEIKPDYAEAYNNMGTALKEQGRLSQAISCFHKALEFNPRFAESNANIGMVLTEQGKLEAAISYYQKAIEIKPGYVEAYYNLGCIFQNKGELSEAIPFFERAIEIKPDYAEVYNDLGGSYGRQASFQKSTSYYEKAFLLAPDYAQAKSNLLLTMLYDPSIDDKTLFSKATTLCERLAGRNIDRFFHKKSSLSERRLRIGYVSPDFCRHSVSYFFLPLISAHDRDAVEVYCYSEVKHPDVVTGQIKKMSDNWFSTVELSDESVANRIRKDRIDILVDLAGHTCNNRLPVFDYKPAPVQVTWLGYPGTTGMSAMDYRLTDEIADPERESDRYHTETLIRLPHGFLCYGPLEGVPDVSNLPALESGRITFASFNNLQKMNEAVVSVWAKILHQVPGSCLLLKSMILADEFSRQRCLDLFLANGIPSNRIIMLKAVPLVAQHLALYHGVDIGLDTFSYNGTTTTCEALWMGVPVITLKGERHAGRVGESILTRLGMPELIAATEDDYVAKAVELAADIEHLTELRTNMRSRMSASPLCDAKTFTRDVENAFRKMREESCGTKKERPSEA